MSHNSVESMRDLAFRKGRNAFKNEREYREALFGAREETRCTEEVERMLEDAKLTADGIAALDRWLGDVINAMDGIVPVQSKVWGLDGATIVLKSFEDDASRVKVVDSDGRCAEIGVDDLQDILDNLSPHEGPDDAGDDDDINDADDDGSVDGLLEKAFSYNTVVVPVMTRGWFISQLRDWIAQGGDQASLIFACGPGGETIALTKPEGKRMGPSLELRHRSKWSEKTITERYAMSEADLLDFIDRHE